MTVQLDGQVVLVTGAGAGLGRAYALLLGSLGARVVVNDLGAAAAETVVSEITALGGSAAADSHDVSTEEGGAAMVGFAVAEFGGLHALVHNAGILRDKSLVKLTLRDIDEVIAVHLMGGFNVVRPAFAHMREQRYGRIVLTTSSSGLLGNFGQANYGAAKMGLVGLMNVAAVEGERHGIKVNAIAPGALTQMTEGLLGDLAESMDPRHVAPLLAYLVSPQCHPSHEIFTAAAGRFARYVVGVTPDDIEENLEVIRDLGRIEVLANGGEEIGLLREVLARRSPAPG